MFGKNNTNVTLIESTEIGILGAGEGVTPHVLTFLKNDLNLNIEDLFKFADATFKNGIKFTNWNGDNTHFYHPFTGPNSISNISHLNLLDRISKKENLDQYKSDIYNV